MIKKFIKAYIKRLTKSERDSRLVFVGKRLKVKQYMWSHYNAHPWESVSKE